MKDITFEERIFNLLNPTRGLPFSAVFNKVERSFPKNSRPSEVEIKEAILYLHSRGKVRFSSDWRVFVNK